MTPQEANPFSPPTSPDHTYLRTPDQRPASIEAYTPEKLTPTSTRPTSAAGADEITLVPNGDLPLKDVQSEDGKEALDHATASLCTYPT